MGRSKHPFEFKLHIFQLFEEGQYSISELCERFSINDQTLYSEAGGREGFQEATSCKFYSKELKLAAVEDDIQRNNSQMEVLAKYEISRCINGRRNLKQTVKRDYVSAVVAQKMKLN